MYADGDGVRVVFESSEANQERGSSQQQDEKEDASQQQDEEEDASQQQGDNITLLQPAATRQAPGQASRHARFTPQLAPPAEQSSQSVPDVTGSLSASVGHSQQPITARLTALLLKQLSATLVSHTNGLPCFEIMIQSTTALPNMESSPCLTSCNIQFCNRPGSATACCLMVCNKMAT